MTLESQYKLFIESNPENSHWTYHEWLKWHSDKLAESIKNINPVVSDDFQIGPDGAYEHIEYSIPIYENGIKTEWTVDGIVGDEKYYQLLEFGNGKDLPDMINTTIKK